MRTARKSNARSAPLPGFLQSLRHFLTPALWKQVQSCCPPRRKRRWDVQPVVLVLLAMTWLTHDTVEERFQVACAAVVACRPKRRRPGRTVPGFLKAVRRLPARVFQLVSRVLRETLVQRGLLPRVGEWFPVGVDGSRLSCARSKELEERLPPVSTASAPQLWITTLVHLLSGVPWSWRVGQGTASERAHLRQLLPTLPKRSLIVADAGYISYALWLSMVLQGHDVLLRLSASVQLFSLSQQPLARYQQGRVLWWPTAARLRGRPAIPARLVRLPGQRGSGDLWLLTSVLDRHRLSRRQVGKLYRLRWENECFFRSYKRTLGKVKLWGRCVKTVHREVEASLLAVQLLLAQVLRSRLPQAAVPSMAKALRAVRQDLLRAGSQQRRLPPYPLRLQAAWRDRRPRHAAKIRKIWPRQKTYRVPRPPQLLRAPKHFRKLIYPCLQAC